VSNVVHDLVQFPIEPQALFTWLKNFPDAKIYLLIDSLEEEVYVEPSPMLFPWEQDAFAQRHLRKHFPKTDFYQYRFDTNKAYPWESRAGSLLISGFNNDHQLIQLLSWLNTAEVGVIGIYSAVFLLPNLFKEVWFSHPKQADLWQDKPHFILSRTGADSFRQYLIVNGSLRTTRQIQLRDQSLVEQMQQLLQEIRMLDKFVHTQKMLDYDITPDLYYLGATEEDSALAWQTFAPTLYASAGRGAFVASNTIAQFEGHQVADADMIMLLAFGQRSGGSDYVPPSLQETLLYQQIKHGLWMFLFALVVVFVSYLVYFFIETEKFESMMQSLQTQHTRYQQSLVQLQSQLDINIPVEHLKNMVETVEHVQDARAKQGALPYFADLSELLKAYPNIQVQELVWTTSDASQQSKKLDADLFDVSVNAVVLATETTRLRDVMDTMDLFLKALKDKPSIEQVELLQKPVDLDSSRPLMIIADDSKASSAQRYPFKLLIRFKRLP
jgi:hypothetical protein